MLNIVLFKQYFFVVLLLDKSTWMNRWICLPVVVVKIKDVKLTP